MDSQSYINIIEENSSQFSQLPLFFAGDSRILKECGSDLLIGEFRPTIFSLKHQGPVELPGIDLLRIKLNALFCQELERKGVKTSTLYTHDKWVLMKRERVPNIEVVVKGALIGSPKHTYIQIDQFPMRSGKKEKLCIGKEHSPYVRFDWRNPLPTPDACMPEALADYFINTEEAKKTALNAYLILKSYLNSYQFDLLDICFFMNESGETICAEVSTDNSNIAYFGSDKSTQLLFASREKEAMLAKASRLLELLK